MWIDIKDKKPVEGQEVFYYFNITGVSRGRYTRKPFKDIEGNCFYGSDGWLTDDVTHWMPDDGGSLPSPPTC